jgi:hypothetical protein
MADYEHWSYMIRSILFEQIQSLVDENPVLGGFKIQHFLMKTQTLCSRPKAKAKRQGPALLLCLYATQVSKSLFQTIRYTTCGWSKNHQRGITSKIGTYDSEKNSSSHKKLTSAGGEGSGFTGRAPGRACTHHVARHG